MSGRVCGTVLTAKGTSQQRLPARLHNASATTMKATLKAPIAANGKPVPGFPNTRGEFEPITSESRCRTVDGH